MNYRLFLSVTLAFFCANHYTLGQSGWTQPDASQFAQQMTVTAVITYGGEEQPNVNDELAVFFNGELRGLGVPTDASTFGLQYDVYYSITVYGQREELDMSFRVYRSSDGRTFNSTTPLRYIPGGSAGDFSSPVEADVPTAALPVELVSFTGRRSGKVTRLDWTTTSEVDNEGFYIERSPTGEHFTTIGFIAGGDHLTGEDYSFTDISALGAEQYYRLRQRDFDGAETYSKVVRVSTSSASPQVYPNPASLGSQAFITLQGNLQEATMLIILDTQGREISRREVSAALGQRSWPLPTNLPAGRYWCHFPLRAGVAAIPFVVSGR